MRNGTIEKVARVGNQVKPFVSMMIVVRNEERYIQTAIQSLLNQQYPKDRMELLIIDGESEDATVQIAKETVTEYIKERGFVAVRYLDNPKKNLAAGWNIGIQASIGEYVVRIDAHAQADPLLIAKCVQILCTHEDVVCAGGRIVAKPLTDKGRVISYVQSSPFGVGNAKFRYTNKSGYVDTVAYGVYRKTIFGKVGLFNEQFQRNQDNDMHGRIKAYGGKFYLDATISSLYHPRETIKGMVKQGYGNGNWVMIGCRKSAQKEGLSLRHMIPLMFVLVNLLLIVSGGFLRIMRLTLIALYMVYLTVATYFGLQKTHSVGELMRWYLCCWLFHISYGVGSLTELLKKSS